MIYLVESMPMLLRVFNSMLSDKRAAKVNAEIEEFDEEPHRGYKIYTDGNRTRVIQLCEFKADEGRSVTIIDFDGDGQMFESQQDAEAVAYIYGLLLGDAMKQGFAQ